MGKPGGERLLEIHDELRALFAEIKKLADENELTFSVHPAYGMGGTYYPKKVWDEETGDGKASDWDYETDRGWRSSSRSC